MLNVELTHSGGSYFKFKGNVYAFNSNSKETLLLLLIDILRILICQMITSQMMTYKIMQIDHVRSWLIKTFYC